MRSTWLIRAARSAVAGALLAATVGASVATAGPAPNRGARRRGANLFALVFGVMNVNRWFCGINNIGELCVDPTNSPVVGGGFWPKGTPDQYIFNSGLQLAGTIPSTAGFAWAGDTVGAFFMDPRGNQARFNISIPDDGYPFTNLFAAFFADEDVGDASKNYSTAVIPFDMMVAYKSDFLEKNWTFPPDIFGPPFVASPGFVGLKFLKSPLGLTIFSNTLNSATGYPDPVGVKQLYRYLSGTSDPAAADFPCTFQGQQIQKHFCFQAQQFADTRSFQSSGPFTLNPGETKTIVEAYIQAAPTPVVSAFVGGDFKPGIPATGAAIAGNSALVRPIERAMGWVSQNDANLDGVIEQNEVTSVPRSLLDKALVAQAVFDNKFLLPFAPDAPQFFLIPGDNRVTVVWQKTRTETTGDPFFAVASNPASPLYDPNFRQFDVEGYRIYRGRTTSALSLVAQFDYAGTSITDFTGGFAYTADLNGNGKSEYAPELGVFDDCPVQFQTAQPFINSVDHDLSGDVIQIPAGGRVKLADGSVLIIKADTAVTGEKSGYPALSNSGVNFAYVDLGVRNSFAYFYAVTAFDVNSLKSGPSSLESPRITKLVTPRAAASNVTSTVVVQGVYGDSGRFKLDPSQDYPAINAATGTFSG